MIRVFLTIVLPLVLPTILYVVWLAAFRRTAAVASAPSPVIPWLWLVAAGVVLTAILLFLLNLRLGVPQGTYVPPHYVNGQVVPGQVVPRDPATRPP